ncbi:SNF2-related protein [Botryosphaeria dothidea]|uniref:SNF2-related protein n=1 Tax=Botryosphaeria dothidea TaxID=55169 RepID=A0A8H4NA61_9PEZI|nr:SNF2-related protein [Botryosphaeria dothidea]
MDNHTAEAIVVLSEERGTLVQIMLVFTNPTQSKQAVRAFLDAIVYGPYGLFEDVGDFTQECNLYLQDPVGCICNLPYINPHRLSKAEHPPMTYDFPRSYYRSNAYAPRDVSEFFANFESEETPDTVNTPAALRTQLHPHQRQALAFMKRRERGLALFGPQKDIWMAEGKGSNWRFLNCITGDEQCTAPPEFKGGILADEMGLGKTLSMIALVASDKDSEFQMEQDIHDAGQSSGSCKQSTLIVVPSPLLQVWFYQLEQHLHPTGIRWTKHHDSHRIVKLQDLRQHDIVLTTYQTIAAERSQGKHLGSPIFTAQWGRIILDEAHNIRNRKNLTAKAVFSLKADCRWAMTGTPVQNSLNDFASLLEFLRVHPFEVPSAFDRFIQNPLKEDNTEEAIGRLKRLVHCIVLRRLKQTVQLPARQDIIRYVHFTPEEHLCYKRVSCPVEKMLDDLAHQQSTGRACPSEPVRMESDKSQLASPEPPVRISSKVAALINDVRAHLDEKSVVFSFWTKSLDMVERALQMVEIESVRFDGRVSARDREEALRRLRDDPQARVLLITTSCGAVGLDLTAASRAYLLEPQWNPTTEDQALARIHRMGQKNPVTTIRLVVKDSFEEVTLPKN